MTLANIVKVLVLITALAQTAMSVLGGIIPVEVSAVINAVIAGILAFTTKIGNEVPKE